MPRVAGTTQVGGRMYNVTGRRATAPDRDELPSLRAWDKRHRLDAVAVGIADEGRIVSLAVMRPQAGTAVRCAAGGERGRMECVDGRRGRGAQADMDAVVVQAGVVRQREHLGPMVEPQLGVALTEPDRG